MKSEVITIKCKDGRLLTYLKIDNLTSLVKLKHKLRIKEIIYDRLFHIYHRDMNFTNSEIIIDNRSNLQK